jgi:hypothetical protein
MFGYRLKLEGELLEKSKKCAEASGYSSLDEFLLHTIEKEVTRLLGPGTGGPETPEEVRKRLQGLGYIE